jgi:diguanylate cyclase (GGDEF)-like protein
MDATNDRVLMRTDPMRRLRYLAWPPPEPELTDAGRAGEIVIARARLFVISLLFLPNLATTIRHPETLSGWIGMGFVVLCLIIGVEILRRARSDSPGRGLLVAASVLDVSVASAYHVLLFLTGEVQMALQSRATFSLYLLAIVGSALRYDGRLVRVAGLVAILQYLGIMLWADLSGRAAAAGALFYGDTSLPGQVEEVCMLLVATALASIIVERARELRLSGIRDPLTKLANRTYFADRLELELQRASRSARRVTLAMIDIDHFKSVNDTHGHAAGDVTLRFVARELRSALRPDELVARLGGEEFAMLLLDSSREEAFRRLDAIRLSLRSKAVEWTPGERIQVTLSIGFSMFPEDGTESVRLLGLADERLLAGKRAGRDVVVAEAEPDRHSMKTAAAS